MKKVKHNEIPVFFATNDNYAPFLAIALKSMLENASENYYYRIYVLTTNLSQKSKDQILKSKDHKASVEFISLQKELDKIQSLFHLRDYYSKETYYRFFIANLFPQYSKVLYLDCDIIVKGDISELYRTDITYSLVAAVSDDAVQNNPVFANYVENALDVKKADYFNAGILLINTKKFRKENICNQFVSLINRITFKVAQDQDYLNVLTKGKVKYVNHGWNKKAEFEPDFDEKDLKIIHYKLGFKPWHYDNIYYEEIFWEYVEKAGLTKEIQNLKNTYTDLQRQKDKEGLENLLKLAREEAESPYNYKNMIENQGDLSKNPSDYKKLILADKKAEKSKLFFKRWMIEVPVAIMLIFLGIKGISAIAVYYGWKGIHNIRRHFRKSEKKNQNYGN